VTERAVVPVGQAGAQARHETPDQRKRGKAVAIPLHLLRDRIAPQLFQKGMHIGPVQAFQIGAAQRVGIDCIATEGATELRLTFHQQNALVEPGIEKAGLRRPDQRARSAGPTAQNDRRR
jgi:hypothetical protein